MAGVDGCACIDAMAVVSACIAFAKAALLVCVVGGIGATTGGAFTGGVSTGGTFSGVAFAVDASTAFAGVAFQGGAPRAVAAGGIFAMAAKACTRKRSRARALSSRLVAMVKVM